MAGGAWRWKGRRGRNLLALPSARWASANTLQMTKAVLVQRSRRGGECKVSSTHRGGAPMDEPSYSREARFEDALTLAALQVPSRASTESCLASGGRPRSNGAAQTAWRRERGAARGRLDSWHEACELVATSQARAGADGQLDRSRSPPRCNSPAGPHLPCAPCALARLATATSTSAG